MKRREFLTAMALGGAVLPGVAAEDRSAFLTIRGQLRRYTDASAGIYQFREDEFMGLKQSSITTATTWTPRAQFDGPRIAEVLQHVGAVGSRLEFLALDDYRINIPMSDLLVYKPILAHSRDGKRMTVREFGPTWVVYPRDEFPEQLNTPQTQAKFIWQVWRITVVA